MSRDPYGSSSIGGGGSRSPRSVRRVTELPTVDRSPSRSYPISSATGGRGSPLGYSSSYHHQTMGSPYYSRDDDLGSPVLLDERGRSTGPGGHHRSRSATRPTGVGPMNVRYQSLDRSTGILSDPSHEREFMPIREPRERSLDRGGRDRSLERGLYLEEELYGGSARSARQSPNPHLMSSREPFLGELQHQNNDLQRELGNLKKELELTNQKLGSSMHSIKTFWSPELKKERALRKEESAKYSLINDQLKLLNSENQKQAMLVRQLEEELRMRMRGPSIEMQQQMEVLFSENEHLTREIAILRDTIKELELRIETQKQTLQARDESIKKLLEMLQNKGMGKEEERQMFQQMQAMAQKQLDEFRLEIQRRDQEILAMSAKMKTLEEQHQDYQRHIAVLKESLCAKEEHYNMLQADVEELRQRLDEKNRHIEKKTQIAMQATQERNRMQTELTELKDHMDIKDRKINVLQRKLDLHEATKKLQATASGAATSAKAGEDLTQQKKQIDDQRRNLENKRKEIEQREKALTELDNQLKKRKEQMDQLEASLRKAGGAASAAGELNKKLTDTQKELEMHKQQLGEAREEAKRSATEMERLLQLVQMSQEEQNSKEKQIMELQQALKNAQGKLRNQQQQMNAQKEEEVTSNDSSNLEDCLIEIEEKNTRLIELETKLNHLEESVKDNESFNFELEKKDIRIKELEQNVKTLEQIFKQQDTINEFEELFEVIRIKDDRIEELEEALRESIHICTERELVLEAEEQKRKQIMEKVSKLEQRLLSLQSAQAMKCHSCRPVINRANKLEQKLKEFVSERRDHLKELCKMKQEALEATISEKDTHLALLEMASTKTEWHASEIQRLILDRKRLMERLKQENELNVQLLEDYDSDEPDSINCIDSQNEDELNTSQQSKNNFKS